MSYITTKACHDLKACYVTRGLSYVRTHHLCAPSIHVRHGHKSTSYAKHIRTLYSTLPAVTLASQVSRPQAVSLTAVLMMTAATLTLACTLTPVGCRRAVLLRAARSSAKVFGSCFSPIVSGAAPPGVRSALPVLWEDRSRLR